MHLKKREFRLPRIKMKKDNGKIEWVTGLFFLLFMAIILCAELQLQAYQFAGLYLEDALAASNLASAVIDIEEYGISHTVRIGNPTEAYARYRDAVMENLQLNDNWENPNSRLISGPVTIERYIVYNVENERVNIFDIAASGSVGTAQGALGTVKAPDGTLITATSVYSEIAFPVKGFLGVTAQAHKGKLADVVSSKEGS